MLAPPAPGCAENCVSNETWPVSDTGHVSWRPSRGPTIGPLAGPSHSRRAALDSNRNRRDRRGNRSAFERCPPPFAAPKLGNCRPGADARPGSGRSGPGLDTNAAHRRRSWIAGVLDERRAARASGRSADRRSRDAIPALDARRQCPALGARDRAPGTNGRAAPRHLAARSRRVVPALRAPGVGDHVARPRSAPPGHQDLQRPRRHRSQRDDPRRPEPDRVPRVGPLGEGRLVHRSVLRRPHAFRVRELLRARREEGESLLRRAPADSHEALSSPEWSLLDR